MKYLYIAIVVVILAGCGEKQNTSDQSKEQSSISAFEIAGWRDLLPTLKEIRVQPVYRSGAVIGYRLSNVSNNPEFVLRGIEDGALLIEVCGFTMQQFLNKAVVVRCTNDKNAGNLKIVSKSKGVVHVPVVPPAT